MSFTVDAAICTHCGLCATGCVCGLIAMNAEGLPYIEEKKQSFCVHCGHCAAVCPSGAVTLDGTSPDKLEPADPPVPSFMVQHLLKTRRAIRNFKPEAPEDSVLQEALDLVAYAPTAHNSRQVSYLVVNGRDKVEKILYAAVRLMEEHHIYPKHTANVRSGHDTLFRGAPCLVLIHAPERILSETDCATAASYLELTLPAFGLGSCWAGMLIEACAYGLPKEIQIPEGHRLYAALMVGKPDVRYVRIPVRSAPEIRWA